ncbi:MAG: hypothetical protein FWD48_04040 [Oscillospiraceae bacterium]|nr:hypothetical protein [Oscillospiraceae bacterium]
MHKVTLRKIVAYGKNKHGGREQVSDNLTEGEYRLLCAVLIKARRTCKDGIDFVTYEPRLKKMQTLIETLNFEENENGGDK